MMVLNSRPAARVTALDIYSGYFGIDDNTPARLRANAPWLGAPIVSSTVTGDMREMPLPDDRFDAAVSVAAIDHVNRDGIRKALAEVSRVVKPGGQFLLVVLNVDLWVEIAYPFPHGHGYFSHSAGGQFWRCELEAAGSRFRKKARGLRSCTCWRRTAGSRRQSETILARRVSAIVFGRPELPGSR